MSGKLGQCRLCPGNGPHVRLYGDGVCAYHLTHHQDDQSKKRAELTSKALEAVLTAEQKRLLSKFYKEQAPQMPVFCENLCGTRLPTLSSPSWLIKTSICHIVEKRHFHSVMVHPANRWFGCGDCHHAYDESWKRAVTMKVWPVAMDRFEHFMRLIPDSELKFLPDAFRTLIENNPPGC